MLEFKEKMRSVFRHYRQVDEICAKVADCIVVVDPDNNVTRYADLGRLTTLIDFMRCFPILVKRDKNSSQGMNYVMDGNSFKAQQLSMRDAQDAEVSARVGLAELEYVKQLMSLIFSRLEDKHRNVTEMFRFMDQRGKGKISKPDFTSAVERMRISLSREDANKVWNYLDTNKNGYIQLHEVSQA